MILVDTSVLVSFLSGKENESTKKLDYIIKHDIPFGINNFIYQELLQGVKSEKEFNLLKEYLDTQKFYNIQSDRQSYTQAANIYFQCRKKGITIKSTIDSLIAITAIENDLFLLHNDSDFTNIAKAINKLKIY